MENKHYNITSFDGTTKITGGSDEYMGITDDIPNTDKLIQELNDISKQLRKPILKGDDDTTITIKNTIDKIKELFYGDETKYIDYKPDDTSIPIIDNLSNFFYNENTEK